MEVYQMPLFTKLLVSNIEKSEKWYQEFLGFKNLFTFTDNNNLTSMIHLRKAKYQDIMLVSAEKFIVGTATFHSILVNDIEVISQKIPTESIFKALQTEPWQAKELTIRDPDGHLITLTQPIPTNANFKQIAGQIRKNFN